MIHVRRLLSALALGLGLTLGPLVLLARPEDVVLADPSVLHVAPGGYCGGATDCYATVQAAVDAANVGAVIKIAQGTYTGVQNVSSLNTATFTATQIVAITKSVTIQGGYTTLDWDTPDPVAHPTTLDAQGQGRALVITGDIAPTVEGLRITSGDATGLGGTSWADVGGGVYVKNATALIGSNVIYSNTADAGGGLYLGDTNASLNSNTISNNTARLSAGGLFLNYCPATLNNNIVSGNTSNGWGGGLYLKSSDATLSGNTVTSNIGAYGGGVCFYEGDGATLSDNLVYSNTASGWGGGLGLYLSDASLSGNIVRGNTANLGGGLYLYHSASTFINTEVTDNQATGFGPGIYVGLSSPRLLHTTIARNSGGDGSGICVIDYGYGNYSTVTLTNTILVSHSVGIMVTAGNTATLSATLWYANGTDYNSNVFHTNDHTGDPAFANPSAGDYHLTSSSAAIDAGVDAGVTMDIDSDTRPRGAGFDLGADEFMGAPAARREIYLPLAVRG